MAALQIGIVWSVVACLLWPSEAHFAKGCFKLSKIYFHDNDSKLDWESVPDNVTLFLSCEDIPNGYISRIRESHSIPSKWDDRCTGCVPPPVQPILGDHYCPCCEDAGIEVCKSDFAPQKSQSDRCTGKKTCHLTVNRRGLGSTCPNMEKRDYACVNNKTGKDVFHCGSRWVNVTYDCVQGNSSTTVSSIMVQAFPNFATIALVVAVCLLLVVIAVITTVFCLRHNRLKKKYFRERRLVSSEGTDGEDAKQDDPVYHKAGPIEDTAILAHQSAGILQTDQNGNGLESPLLDGVGNSKIKKHDYENVKNVPNGEYTQVDIDLKKKNRSVDIDGSNVWHNPDKESKGVWKAEGQGKATDNLGQKERGGHEEMELIENVYYEGGRADQVESNEKNQKKDKRRKCMDTDYEEL